MKFFQIHAENPQPRLVRQAVDVIRKGGVIIYPADNSYAMGCGVGEKAALDRIRMIRRLDDKHNFTLLCRDLSELGLYAKVGTSAFRLLKAHLPGPYTFILDATREVPRMLMHPKKRTIGIRVPDNRIVQAIVAQIGEPLMSSSLILPGEEIPLSDPYDIRDLLGHELDVIVDGGFCGFEATTVVDLSEGGVEIARQGVGDASAML